MLNSIEDKDSLKNIMNISKENVYYPDYLTFANITRNDRLAGLQTFEKSHNEIKATKEEANYIKESVLPDNNCSNCKHFDYENMKCHVVAGDISAYGYSDLYEPKVKLKTVDQMEYQRGRI